MLRIAFAHTFSLGQRLKPNVARIMRLSVRRLDSFPPNIVSKVDDLFRRGIGANKAALSALDVGLNKLSAELNQLSAELTAVRNEISEVKASIASIESAMMKSEQLIEGAVDSGKDKFKRLSDREQELRNDKKRLSDKEMMLMDDKKQLMDGKKQLTAKKEKLVDVLQAQLAEHIPDYVQAFITYSLETDTILKPPPFSLRKSPRSDYASFITNRQSPLVDKTAMIQYLILGERVVYRRPRRYGKSLTLSMLKYYFYGATRLFESTAVFECSIESGKYRWCPSDKSAHCFPPRPVLHFDFSASTCSTKSDFEGLLRRQLKIIGNSYGVPEACYTSSGNDVAGQLDLLIEELCRSKWNLWGDVVVLVDEYDNIFSRLDSVISSEEKAKVSSVIKSMFSMIKSKDSRIAFAYVTGITSYGMAGLYSGANNFDDLSYDENLHSLCGFTEDEVRQVLGSVSDDEFSNLKNYYNGYSFLVYEPKTKIPRVFNPVAINKYYSNRKLQPYWIMTSSESLVKNFPVVLKLVPNLPYSIEASTLAASIDYSTWNSTEVSSIAKMLFESGYLTVIGFKGSTAILDLPNEEVRSVISSDLKSIVLKLPSGYRIEEVESEVNSMDSVIPLLMLTNACRANSTYWHQREYDLEATWHLLVGALLFCTRDLKFSSEQANAYGRSDILLLTSAGTLFVIEFKLLKDGAISEESAKVLPAQWSTVDKMKVKKRALDGIQQIIDKKYDISAFSRSDDREIKSVQYVSIVAVNSGLKQQFAYLLQQPKNDPSSQVEYYFP